MLFEIQLSVKVRTEMCLERTSQQELSSKILIINFKNDNKTINKLVDRVFDRDKKIT